MQMDLSIPITSIEPKPTSNEEPMQFTLDSEEKVDIYFYSLFIPQFQQIIQLGFSRKQAKLALGNAKDDVVLKIHEKLLTTAECGH